MEVVGEAGCLDFAFCQKLGCHLATTCLQDGAWILADLQKCSTMSFVYFCAERKMLAR